MHPHEPPVGPPLSHNDDWYHKAHIEHGLYMQDRYNAEDKCKNAFGKRMARQSFVVIIFELKSVLCMASGYFTPGA